MTSLPALVPRAGCVHRHLLPALAAVTLVVAGPQRARLEVVHAPRLVLFFALAAALLASGRLARRDFAAREWLGLAALGAMLVSALFATSPAYTLVPIALAAASLAVMLGTAHRADERERWLGWLGGAVVVVAALGLLESLGVGPGSLRGRAPSGPMGQRNALAHVLLLGSPLAWTLALRAATPRARALWWAGSALVAAVVVITRSRAAWVAFVPTALLFGLLTRPRALVAPLVGGAVAFVSPVVLAWKSAHPYTDTLRRLVEWRSGSGAGRLVEWKASLAAWADAPVFGLGPGQWFVEYGVVHAGGHYAHSDLVGLLFERGLVGLALLVALAVMAALRWRGTAELALVVPTLVAAGVVGLFDSVLPLPAPLLLVSCVAFVGARPGTTPVRDRPAAAPFALACAATVSATASLLLATADATPFTQLELAARLNPLDGELRHALAEGWASAGDLERARPHQDALKRLLPRHPWLAPER